MMASASGPKQKSVGGRAPTLRDAVRTYQLTSSSPIPIPSYRPTPAYPTTFTSIWRGTLDHFSQNHPKPFAYQFYVTTPIMPEELPKELFEALVDDLDFSEVEYWRIDIWHFPGAGMETCMEHYGWKVEWEQGERIRRVGNQEPGDRSARGGEETRDGEEGSGKLESVPSYVGNHWGTGFHHLFFIIDTANWRHPPPSTTTSTSAIVSSGEPPGGIRCIQFDKHPDEAFDEGSGDVREYDTTLRQRRVGVIGEEESDDDSLGGGGGGGRKGGLGGWLQSVWNVAEVRGDYQGCG